MAYLAIDGSIETDRLILRKPTSNDAGALGAIFGDPDVMRSYGKGDPYDRDRMTEALAEIERHYVRYGYGAQAIALKNTGALVGLSGLQRARNSPCVQIGWALAKEAWRKGYASECGVALLEYGFATLGLGRIEANTISHNEAAISLIRKIGMTYEGIVRFEGAEYARFAAFNIAPKGRPST
jgi:RimJ/RimL family protein N-acetyltransferase